MAQGKRKVSVTIFAEPYIVLGNEEPGYIEGVAALVDKKMRLIAQRQPRLSPAKVAVLAALNLADELTRLRQEQQALAKLLEEDQD